MGTGVRANGQPYQGKRTHIGWTAREIVLPTIPGNKASGAIIKVAGLNNTATASTQKKAYEPY